MKTCSPRLMSWEAHLIYRAALGESVAFELLVDLYRPTLQSLALRMLRNSDDAHDAVQETLVKAYRALKDFDPERPIRPWLCRICANCCVDAVRNRKRSGDPLEQHEYMLQDGGESLDERASESIERDEVHEAISRLPEKYRRIIFMRHFRHMDVNEIALELNKPEGTIKSWLFRARALLKKDLQVALG
ncbi:MAG: sigma-70 family RNA polymerase sigma factor [Fimbriimonadaceae bacterium]|nr:sigma-70 family RNA polymerase sigma factor [Chthonomonadaceae bacterium]MCO5295905.1 sigma-70 family RNA polymerase sigma factor [Fimbriimonadaceae bacterium]